MNRRLLLLLAVLTFSFTQFSYAQQSGTVKGTITDETGAIIPATTVRLVAGNGTAREAQTNESGVYTFAGVKPGSYTLRIALPGFSPVEKAAQVSPGTVA